MQKLMGLLLVLFLSLSLFSCGKQRLWVKGKVHQKVFNQEIPIQVINGLIFLEVAINGKAYNFLLDTGAPTLLDTQVVQALGLKTKKFGTATDSYGRSNRIDYTVLKTVSISGVDFLRQGALVSDLRSIPVFDCLDVDGLLGANLMRSACWQIDYEAEVLRVSEDCSGFSYTDEAIYMPFRVNSQGTPKLAMNFGDSLDLSYVTLDFGSSSGLSLDLEASARIFDPAEADLFTTGAAGVGLYGVEKDSIWFTSPEALVVAEGDTLFSMLRVRVRRKGGHLFGTQILQEFRSTIDWQNHQLVLEPIGENLSPVWLNFGCALQPNGEVLEVGQLVYPSGAVEAGLMVGDTVLTINSQPVYATDFCEARTLFGGAGPIKLTIQRQGNKQNVVLRRQDLFSTAK
jgi:hypothetical protein